MVEEEPTDIPPKKEEVIGNLNPGTINTTPFISDPIKNKLTTEISRLDKWASVGADNGLFLIKDNRQIYDKIINGLRDSRLSIERNDIPETQRQLSLTLQSYSEAVNNTTSKWRFINLNGGYVFMYLIGVLISIIAFYTFWGIQGFEGMNQFNSPPFGNAPEFAIHAVVWGMVGGTLRGLWFLKDKVGDRKFRKSWTVYFTSVPFLGGIFGALIYLVIMSGMLALNPDLAQSSIPSAIPPLKDEVMNLDNIQDSISEATKKLNATPELTPTRSASSTNQADSKLYTSPSIESISFNRVQSNNSNVDGAPSEIPEIVKETIALMTETSNQINETKNSLISVQDDISESHTGSIITQPLAIMLFAALAGFNWEWLLSVIKRTSQNVSQGDPKSFDSFLAEDITKLDR